MSSFDCEVADNAQEKERLKYLKQDGNNKANGTPVNGKDKGGKAEKDKSHK